MPHIHLATVGILIVLGFLAGFIDSAVGGGGLISLPALLFVGLPPALALGTNKLAGTMGAVTSAVSFLKSGKIEFSLVKFLVPLSLLGSIAGASLVHFMPSAFLRPLVIVMLIAVTIYTLFKRDIGRESRYVRAGKKALTAACLTAAALGFYDGFFGPGTGSFLIIAFLFMGFDFIESAGNAKALNLASNIGALSTFAILGAIVYAYGLVLGAAMMIGAVVGSQFAIRKGVAFIRPIYICVTFVMIGKQVWTALHL